MAHKTSLNSGTGGDDLYTIDMSLNTYPTGAGKMPASVMYVSPNDTTAPTPVTDANPFPIDGTVTANLGAVDNAVLDAIAASLAGTLTVGSHEVTNAGTFATQITGDALTSLQLIDNAVSGAGFNITQFAGASVPIGGGVEATALRVTIASDSTGVVSIDDNGGSITVDGSVSVSGSVAVTGTFWQATQPVSIESVPSHDVTNTGVFVVQVNGDALTSLQLIDNLVLAEDAGHVSGNPGVMSLAVRNDSDASLCDTTLDYTPLQVDANGYLKVNIKAGAGSGGTALTDDAAFTAASTSFTPVGGIVTADSVDSGDGGAFAMLANRQQKVTLYDSGGSEIAVGGGTQYTEGATDATITGTAVLWEDAADTLVVVSAEKPLPVSLTSVVPGTGATNLGKAEDAAHTTGDTGVMALGVRRDSGATIAGSDGDYVPLSMDESGRLRANVTLPNGVVDVFGALRSAQQHTTIDIQFYRDVPANLVTVTTTNSGTASQSVGAAIFATSSSAGGSSKGVSYTNLTYSGGAELYAYFTAAFSQTGASSSYMRVGLYDTNNGAFIGFENTTFSATYRNNASDTSVAAASFNGDLLNGGTASKFTRAGVPEAINYTLLNVYRIRLGWVGGANILYEVLAPDGHWVTFHTVRFPNSSAAPSIRTADLPVTLDVAKTGGPGTDLSILTGCWAAGNTAQRGDQLVIGAGSQTALNNNVVLDAAGSAAFDVLPFTSVALQIVPASGTVTAGAITFEASNNNSTWTPVELYDEAAPTAAPVSTYTIAASTTRYFDGPIRYRYFRARISTGVTGTTTGIQCFSRFLIAEYIPLYQPLAASTASIGTVTASGTIAHDAADSGSSPVKIGSRAVTSISAQTLVTANDRTDLLAGLDGVQITRQHANLEDIVTATPVAITDGSSTSVLASPGAGLKNCITSIAIANSSASFVTVDLRDGTAGAVLWTFPVPATGGVVYTFPMPLRCSAATALAADPSAAASTITVSVIGFKSKV